MKKILLFITVLSCTLSCSKENSDTLDNQESKTITLLTSDVPVTYAKNVDTQVSANENNNYTDSHNYYNTNTTSLYNVLKTIKFNHEIDNIIKVDLYVNDISINKISNVEALSIYYLNSQNIMNHKYYKNNKGRYINDVKFNGQLDKLYASYGTTLHSYSFSKFSNNRSYHSFLTNDNTIKIKKEINSKSLRTLIYENLTHNDLRYVTNSRLSNRNPTCGGRCDYGSDFEDCVNEPVLTEEGDEVSGSFCDDNGCICCARWLGDNSRQRVDMRNGYSFRDNFLQTNSYTRSYITNFYLVSDIYCNENLYELRNISTYYDVYSIIEQVSKRLADQDYNDVILATHEATSLDRFIDSEISRNSNYSLLVSILNSIKEDVSRYKNRSKSYVMTDINTRS